MSIQEQLHASRAEQRKQRLLEAERELAEEEAEALKMTEEQRQTLLQSFKSVTAEFADLDGLRWTQTALRKFQPPQRRAIHVSGSGATHIFSPSSTTTATNDNTFVVLTNADLASFSGEDTIRVPSTHSSRTAFPSPLLSLSLSSPKVRPTKRPSLITQQIPLDEARKHRDGTRRRSPVKGIFVRGDDDELVTGGAARPPRLESAGVRPDEVGEFLSTSPPEQVEMGSGPPGLTPAPTYTFAPSATSHHFGSASPVETGSVSKPLGVSSPSPSYSSTKTIVPHCHRDAPCPPNQLNTLSSASPTRATLVSPSFSLSNSLTSRSSPDLLSVPRQVHGYPQRSPLSRLHSLLNDENRRGVAFPAPPPVVSTSKPHRKPMTSLDTPPAPLDLSHIRFASDREDGDGSNYDPYIDDDETPMPSPTVEYGELDAECGVGGATGRDWRPWLTSYTN